MWITTWPLYTELDNSDKASYVQAIINMFNTVGPIFTISGLIGIIIGFAVPLIKLIRHPETESDDDNNSKSDKNLISHAANYVGYLSVPATIAFATGVSIAYLDQPVVILSVFLGSISIGLAIAIFAIQQSQGAKLQGVVDEVYRFTGEVDRLLKEKREIYANSIVEYTLVFREKFIKAFEIKKSLTDMKKDEEAKNATKTIQLMYQDIAQNRRPTYTTMEMLDVFGKKVGSFWNEFLKNASFDERFSTKDVELDEKLRFGLFMNCNSILQLIVEDILIYASENVKEKIT